MSSEEVTPQDMLTKLNGKNANIILSQICGGQNYRFTAKEATCTARLARIKRTNGEPIRIVVNWSVHNKSEKQVSFCWSSKERIWVVPEKK